MFKLVKGLLGLGIKMTALVLGIGGIVAFANLSDVEGWKRELVDRVSTVSGRKLSIDGDIDFEVSLPPRIVAEGVRIENAPWGSRPDMLRADRLVADVELMPLLLGDVAVPRVRLEGVDILVETNAAGEGNWDDLDAFQTAAGVPPATPSFPVFGPVFGSGDIGFSGGTVTVSNLVTGAVNTLTLPAGPIDVAASVSIPNPCN